jgi:hypothetical protein
MHRESLSLVVKLNVTGEYQLHVCTALDLVGLRMVYLGGGGEKPNQETWSNSSPTKTKLNNMCITNH